MSYATLSISKSLNAFLSSSAVASIQKSFSILVKALSFFAIGYEMPLFPERIMESSGSDTPKSFAMCLCFSFMTLIYFKH